MSKNKIEVHDVGKLFLFALLILSTSLLVAIGKIGIVEWALVVVGVTSYLTGNGLIASKGGIAGNALGPAVESLTPTEAAALVALARTAARVQEAEEDPDAPPPRP